MLWLPFSTALSEHVCHSTRVFAKKLRVDLSQSIQFGLSIMGQGMWWEAKADPSTSFSLVEQVRFAENV